MNTFRHRFLTSILLLSISLVPGLLFAQGEVNVYSARQEALIKPLMDRFTEETGIRVNIVSARADALLQRLRSEGRNTPADVLITVDAGNLHSAVEAGVLQPIRSDNLEAAIPESYRNPEGYWYGLSMRARPIMYVRDKVDPAEFSTYEDLADPKWRGRICVRSSSNVYNQSMTASMIIAHGEEATETWARGLVANMARPPQGGDRDQIRAAAAGQCDIAIANTYYLGQMHHGDDADRRAADAIGVFWPNQDDRGVHVNVSGAGVTAHARNRDNAIRLLEFMAGDEAQAWYAEANQEYPVKPDVPHSETLAGFGEFKADAVNLGLLGAHNAAAVRLMDRAGWR
ncbi:Fe(3+) ABC transporter substrate-binding protein [Thioalkalivibrio denitrificans]|uniref:Fe(3+) ABC transporter substrate-binding protein n=1 Tax=Thioalkalivibrio denitrificans TaxID=108003 RepID=A0A1V3NCS8_9GAMM|nr:Fe(3+) ABC transporter substrate-binding protein [Thioalkalivibrio denitrificans]OOG22743.1 Fe(3+) ABC transporter substrate-binding protein [Thioalkalivibrio denitrificans]